MIVNSCWKSRGTFLDAFFRPSLLLSEGYGALRFMPRKRAQLAQRTIQRKIQFYGAEFRAGDDSNSRVEIADPRALFDHIRGLRFGLPANQTSRYGDVPDGNLVAMLTTERVPLGVHGIIGTIRRNALPDIEQLGRLQALSLPRNAGLFEATHFVLFLPQRILGLEFNFFGPRSGRLEQYLLEKCPGLVDDVQFTPILRQDVQERLSQIGEVSLIRLAVRRNEIEQVRQLNESLAEAFQAAREAIVGQGAEIVEVVLRKRPYVRGGGFGLPFSRERVLEYLRGARARDATDAFSVRAQNTDTGNVETFDLLEDRLIVQRHVILAGTRRRSVDSESMFRAIEEEFRAHAEELARFAHRG